MINGAIPSSLIERQAELVAVGVILVSANYSGVSDWTAALENQTATCEDMVHDAIATYDQVIWTEFISTVQT